MNKTHLNRKVLYSSPLWSKDSKKDKRAIKQTYPRSLQGRRKPVYPSKEKKGKGKVNNSASEKQKVPSSLFLATLVLSSMHL